MGEQLAGFPRPPRVPPDPRLRAHRRQRAPSVHALGWKAWNQLKEHEKICQVFYGMGYTLPIDGPKDGDLSMRALPGLDYPTEAPTIPQKLTKKERNKVRALKG